MPTPAFVRTYTQILTTGTPGQRIPYVSVVDVMQNYIFKIKTFLLANGCVLKWTASAGVGPAGAGDATDRINSAADWTPRGTSAGTSQAWFVVVDGNGGQLLIAFQGSADNICLAQYSPTASFALATPSERQPTAPDGMTLFSTVDVTGTVASGDRIVHGHISSDAKAYRFWLAKASAPLGMVWGVENFTPQVVAPAFCTEPVFASAWSSAKVSSAVSSSYYQGFFLNSSGGRVRTVVSSIQYLQQVGISTWFVYNSTAPNIANFINTFPALQGSLGFIAWPNVLMSSQVAPFGYLGELIDNYGAEVQAASACGDGFGADYGWYLVGVALFPNPSGLAPTIT